MPLCADNQDQNHRYPKERYKAIFKSVIHDRENLYEYVAYLLSDSWLLSSLEQMGTDRLGKNKSGPPVGCKGPVLYENMLKTVAGTGTLK